MTVDKDCRERLKVVAHEVCESLRQLDRRLTLIEMILELKPATKPAEMLALETHQETRKKRPRKTGEKKAT